MSGILYHDFGPALVNGEVVQYDWRPHIQANKFLEEKIARLEARLKVADEIVATIVGLPCSAKDFLGKELYEEWFGPQEDEEEESA